MRDVRIDLLRGYAMLTVAINHLGVVFKDLGLSRTLVPTLTNYGFSSAAEIFFLLSGYMVGMIYVRKNNYKEKLWSRAFTVYCYNAGAFIPVILICWYFGEPLASATNTAQTLADPVRQTLRFLLLLQHPDFLDVLNLYVVLILVAPACIWLFQRSPIPCALISLCFYILAQRFFSFNLIGGSPGGDGLWNMNPAAWQLIFFGGVLAGNVRLHERLFRWLEAKRRRPLTVLIILGLAVLCHQSAIRDAIPAHLWDKKNLSPLRLAHALLVVTALCSLIVLASDHLQHGLARLVALAGRQTLDCYAVSIPLTYALGGLWVVTGRSYLGYLAACLVVIAVVISVAYLTELRRRPRRRAQPETPSVPADYTALEIDADPSFKT